MILDSFHLRTTQIDQSVHVSPARIVHALHIPGTYQTHRPTVRQAMSANVLSATKKVVQQQNMCPHVVCALTGRASSMIPFRRICFSFQAIWISRSLKQCLRSKCVLIITCATERHHAVQHQGNTDSTATA